MNKNEINILVTSDPDQGAINRTPDGAYFEVQLDQGGIQVPSNAKSCFLSAEQSQAWWTIPNIITGVNDKLYLTGPEGIETTSSVDLGYDVLTTFTCQGFLVTLTNNSSNPFPLDAFITGDILSLPTPNQDEFPVGNILTNTVNQLQFTTTSTVLIINDQTQFNRIRGGGISNYVITFPQGLYDLTLLNNALITQLENAGSATTEPIISFGADNASQKVQIRFPFPSSSVDFSQPNTINNLLGFDDIKYGGYPNAPVTITATDVASFNQVNYLLIHTDLTSKGIRFNNQYTQVVSQVLIDVPPGSQIISTPFNPPRIPVPELIGAQKTSIRVWLTDEKGRYVNTNGEYFSARFKIEYFY